VSRHRLTVSLVGRREGTGLLTSLPSLCFGPSVHASGRQGQGPARFLVPLVNRGPVARRASSVGTAHSVHSPAPGGGRNERSEERAVILPSHHGPSPSLPAEPGQGSDRLSLISSVPSLRRVTSFPVTSVRYALRSLRSLSFFACHVIPALRPRGRNRDGTARSLTSPPSLPRPVPFVSRVPSSRLLLTHSLPSSVLRLVPLLGRPPEGNGMSVRRETEQREAIDDGRAHSRYALSSLTRVSCHSPRREE